MIDKVNNFIFERAYAQTVGLPISSNSGFFGLFNPLNVRAGSGNAQQQFTAVLTFVINWVLAIVAVIAFVYLIIAGVNYITAGGDADKATKARTGILNAIIGIVVVVLAFFILRFATTLGQNVAGQ